MANVEPAPQPHLARPVLSREQFEQLCLEGSSPATGSRVHQATFVPLAEDEAPRAGMLLGLDAEFVALSQPDRRIIECAKLLPLAVPCLCVCSVANIACEHGCAEVTTLHAPCASPYDREEFSRIGFCKDTCLKLAVLTIQPKS